MLDVILKEDIDGAEQDHGIVEPARDFADRIAANREIAGVHFKADSDAGKILATKWVVQWTATLKAAKTQGAVRADGSTDELVLLVREILDEWGSTPTLRDAGEAVTHEGFTGFATAAEVIANAVKEKLKP